MELKPGIKNRTEMTGLRDSGNDSSDGEHSMGER